MNGFVKSFVYPFLAALVIFGFIAAIAAGPTLDRIFNNDGKDNVGNDDGDKNSNSQSSGLKSNSEGMLTLLLIGTDEVTPVQEETGGTLGGVYDNYNSLLDSHAPRPTRRIDFLTLISFDSARSRTLICSIPSTSLVTISDVSVTMDTAYYYIENGQNGADYSFFADFVTYITGLHVDFYAYIDTDDYVSAFSDWGEIPITLDEGAQITGQLGEENRIYNAGSQNIDSVGLYDIIKYSGFKNAFTKANVLEAAAKFALDKTATSGYLMNFKENFDKNASKFYNTNVTYEEFEKKIMLYFSYEFYNTAAINVIGDISVDGTRFNINRSRTLSYFKQ